MEVEDARPRETSCICKENLKKYSTLPILGLALLLLTNTAISVVQRQGGNTSVKLCHNFTIPSLETLPVLPAYRTNFTESKVKFRETSPHCLPEHSLHLGEDIYVSVCDYEGSVRVDIRRFVGDVEREGILPTIRGIYLSVEQWNTLKIHFRFIDSAILNLNHGR